MKKRLHLNRYNAVLLIIYILLMFVLYFFITFEIEQDIKEYKTKHFTSLAKNTQAEIDTLVREKQHATLAMVISLAQSDIHIKALKNNTPETIDLNKVSKHYRKNTAFKNVWLQISDKNGNSFKRSWTDKRGDNLFAVREDLKVVYKEKAIKSSISVGKFSITFKSMVPMFDKGEFLGVFEIITHFNSIDRKLQKEGILSVVLAHKKYKEQLKNNLTKNFIQGYYVANLDANPTVVKNLEQDIEKYLHSASLYHIYDEEKILTVYRIKNNSNENIGYYIAVIPKALDGAKLDAITTNGYLYGFISFIVLSVLLFSLLDKKNIIAQLNDDRKKRDTVIILTVIFIVFEIILYLLLFTEKENKISQFLEQKTFQNQTIFHQAYNKYEDFADMVFQNTIDTAQVKKILAKAKDDKDSARELLYTHLKDKYKNLKKYNLKQLHFHLPNNESFLRFHRPDKYGDDLTRYRPTVRWVNKTKEPIDGFEEGRIYNGFRFVYPIFDAEEHLGSVEVSFSVLSLMQEFLKNFDYKTDFFIRKSIVDEKLMDDEKENYIDSPLPSFYHEKSIKQFIFNNHNNIGLCDETKESLKKIDTKILQSRSFSLHLCSLSRVITYIPILNPITKDTVGVLAIARDEAYIKNKNLNTKLSFSILSIFMLFLLIFIYRELIAKNRLRDLNKSLKKLVETEVEKNRQKDQIMTQQAKLAAMGEMIGAIAHQWRQPLNALNINIQNLDDDYAEGLIDEDFIDEFIQKQSKTIQFMSKTIDDFRNFFRVDKQKIEFSLNETVQKTVYILNTKLSSHQITLTVNCDDTKLLGYKSEFQQMLLNIISNAKDAIIENNPQKRLIEIYNDSDKLYIKDHAGGIPQDMLDKVFEAYFTTKEEGKGTGMGLYMSKMIIEKNMGEKLNAYNTSDGAVFTITLGHSKVKQ